jgi:hypothetical protein
VQLCRSKIAPRDLKVRIFGLDTGAQLIVLQGLSTYTALASAYFLARPVLRGQVLQAHRDVINSVQTADTRASKVIKAANSELEARALKDHPLARWDNGLGIGLLIVSIILFTAAIGLQVFTDPHLLASPPSPPAKVGG